MTAIDTPSLGNRSYLVENGETVFVVDPQGDIDRVLDLAKVRGSRVTDVFDVGTHMRVRMATPGRRRHPPLPRSGGAWAPPRRVHRRFAAYGSTGRPDPLGPAHTGELVRRLCASAHRLADVLSGDAYPAYDVHVGPANSAGPSAPDLTPPEPVDPAELRTRIDNGDWVVDLRSRTAFAAGHLVGTLNVGVDGSFATRMGRHIPWGIPLSLLGDTAHQVADARRELVRIGIGRVEPAATGTPEAWSGAAPLGSFLRADFGELAMVRPDPRSAGPSRRGLGRRGVGALPGRLPRVDRSLGPRRGRTSGRRGGRRGRPGGTGRPAHDCRLRRTP